MKLYIPEIGDEIILTAHWTFDLYNESRNETLMEKIGDTRQTTWGGNDYGSIPCTIPEGAKLKIDRVYIRKGISEYSSISFLWVGERTQSKVMERTAVAIGMNGYGSRAEYQYTVKKPARPIRFWAKLEDVNKIEFEMAR